MRKMMTMLLLAATAMPAMASAQSQGELRRDRQDIRQQQQQLQNAKARGDNRDIREQRGDVRDARQEYREDFRDRNHRWGNNDWQTYRGVNRNLYARGNFRAPFRYRTFGVGALLTPGYYAAPYWINDPWRYRLPAAPRYARWIRHYNDVLLVDYRRGRVLRAIRNFYY